MVDKLFIMLKESKVRTVYDIAQAWKDFYNDPANSAIKDEIDFNYVENLHSYILQVEEDYTEEDIAEFDEEELEEWKKSFNYYLKKKKIKRYSFSEKVDDKKTKAQVEFAKWFSKQIKEKDAEGKPKYFKERRIEVIQYDTNKNAEEMSRAARNNMIVDLTRNIMSNPDISHLINTPGNYNKLGMESDRNVILRNPDHVQKWAELKGLKDYDFKGIANSILKASQSEIEKFLEDAVEVRNPLDIETYAYYHNQNMTGGKLIGIYANNTTMQAKYQRSELSMAKQYSFTLNGFLVGDLNVQKREIDGVDMLVSKNCAEFSAASVDNVKDPKLANLMQSTENAFITGTMLRMGLTIQEIGLFFSLPFFDTKAYKILGKDKELIKKYQSQKDVEITSEELAQIVIGVEDSELDEKARIVLARIVTVAEEVNRTVNISRADSPNGAIKNTLAGAINQVNAVDIFHNRNKRTGILEGVDSILHNNVVDVGSTKEQVREAIKSSGMPLLQGFYYLGIENALQIAGTQFKQINSRMKNAIRALNIEYKFEDMPDKIVQQYLREAVVYGLSSSDLFKEDINKQRAYYMMKFAADFQALKESGVASNYGVIKALSVDKWGNIVLQNAPRLKGVRELFQRDFNLMLMDDNEAVRELALNLFKYSYFIDGLDWRFDGFSQLFDSLFLSSIPSYINTLRSLTFNNNDGLNWNNFHDQFIRNHAYELFLDVKDSGTPLDDGGLLFDLEKDNKVKNASYYNKPFKYILKDGTLYVLNLRKSDDKKTAVYYPIDDLDYTGQGFNNPVYDANNEDIDNFVAEAADFIAETKQSTVEEARERLGIEEEILIDDNNDDSSDDVTTAAEDMAQSGNEENDNNICSYGVIATI